MTKYIWDKRKGTWVEAQAYVPPRVHVQSDFAEPFASPITGEAIHTRSQYDRHLKTLGCHVKEPGDVAKRAGPDRQAIRADVKRSLQRIGVVG